MSKWMLLLFHIFIVGSVGVYAQEEFPKREIFGGFSLLHQDAITPPGFQAGVAFNFTKQLGIVGDLGGQYKDRASLYEYLFGPQFAVRQSRTTAFVHALFGGFSMIHVSSHSFFSMGFGGGIDVNVKDRLAVRLVQIDWIPIKDTNKWYNKTVRFGFGLVFK
jgi:opacity protein-like surface antigen